MHSTLNRLQSGLLWLDLVNSEVLSDGGLVELLPSLASLADLLGTEESKFTGLSGKAAQSLLAEAHIFRDELRDVAGRIEVGRSPSAKAVAATNRLLAAEMQTTRLVYSSGKYELRTERIGSNPERFLAPIAQSVAKFLVEEDYSRLRRCGNPACVIHFYDTTKNASRKFCSPAVCGNRMKVAAHYRRKRERETSA